VRGCEITPCKEAEIQQQLKKLDFITESGQFNKGDSHDGFYEYCTSWSKQIIEIAQFSMK
jgi:hypothetical protein